MFINLPKGKPKVISCGFADVLTQSRWNDVTRQYISTLIPNDEFVKQIFKYFCEGYEIHIVPHSYANHYDISEIEKFIKLEKLPIESILYTMTRIKEDAINELKPSIHFDSNKFILRKLPQSCTGVLVSPCKIIDVFDILSD